MQWAVWLADLRDQFMGLSDETKALIASVIKWTVYTTAFLAATKLVAGALAMLLSPVGLVAAGLVAVAGAIAYFLSKTGEKGSALGEAVLPARAREIKEELDAEKVAGY